MPSTCGRKPMATITKSASREVYKRVGMGQEEARSKNPLKASKKAAAGR